MVPQQIWKSSKNQIFDEHPVDVQVSITECYCRSYADVNAACVAEDWYPEVIIMVSRGNN